jgi:tetratricopeptide (TPR) repeat protein
VSSAMSAESVSLEEVLAAIEADELERASSLCAALVAEEPTNAEAIHLLGVIGYQGGVSPDQVLDLIDQAIALDDSVGQFHNSRGAVLYAQERDAEAERSLRRAISLSPSDGSIWNNLGNALLRLNRVEEAEDCFRQALFATPGLLAAINNLGVALKRRGQLDKALICFREAVTHDPLYLDAYFNAGELCYYMGRMGDAEAAFRRVLEIDPEFAPAHASLAQTLHDLGRADEALAALKTGLQHSPDDADLNFSLRLQLSSMVPAWHIPMINDEERNLAYDAALCRAIRPGDLVLEIGTGSGIVAMMAARAGAARVITCELLPIMAETAQEVVRANGLGPKITVINKKSTQLRVGEDLPEKADVFVSELVNVGMLAPNMLAVLAHARENLVKPDAKIIPQSARVFGALIQCDHLARVNPVRAIHGFDMSLMDRFRSPGYAQIDLAADPHRLLSEKFAALDFDFRRDMKERDQRSLVIDATAEGLCHGIAFWFDLAMDDETVYRSDSPARTNHWKQAVEFFPKARKVKPGDKVEIVAGYDQTRIFFRPAAGATGSKNRK